MKTISVFTVRVYSADGIGPEIDAKALLAEAAALIEGQADAPTTPAPPDPSGVRPPVFPR